ncbi:MAG TPA: DUF2249 domain-containing protein [Chloroflexota bacterium]|nr:DUF2249 domain-containing protein [Chloroflexota bacterium]
MYAQTPIDLDVRALAPRERHERIFRDLAHLAAGQSLRLINDHDPKPLYYQLMAEHPGVFDWTPDEQGPAVWSVVITRRTP